MVAIQIEKEFDLLEKRWDQRVFVKLYVAARTSGLLAAKRRARKKTKRGVPLLEWRGGYSTKRSKLPDWTGARCSSPAS